MKRSAGLAPDSRRPASAPAALSVRDLLHIYQKYPALYEADDELWTCSPGFNANDGDRQHLQLRALRERTKKESAVRMQLHTGSPSGLPGRCFRNAAIIPVILDNEHGSLQNGRERLLSSKAVKSEVRRPAHIPYPCRCRHTELRSFASPRRCFATSFVQHVRQLGYQQTRIFR